MKMRLTLQVMITQTCTIAELVQEISLDLSETCHLERVLSHATVWIPVQRKVFVTSVALGSDMKAVLKSVFRNRRGHRASPSFPSCGFTLSSCGCSANQSSRYNPGVWQLPHLPHAAVAELSAGGCACPPAPICSPPQPGHQFSPSLPDNPPGGENLQVHGVHK